MLEPIQARYHELIDDHAELGRLLRSAPIVPARCRRHADPRVRRDRSRPGVNRGRRGSDPVDRRILTLALPALGSLAVEPVYVLVDTAIVGRLGTDQLAGLAIAATVLSFVFAGANFLTYGTTERVARRLGAGDPARRRQCRRAGDVAVAAVRSYRPLPCCSSAPGRSPAGSGPPATVLDHAETYLSLSAIGVPFFLVTLAAQGVLRGASDYITPLWVLLGANVANLLIELVFVFVFDMGVAGSALSTVIAQIGAALTFLWILRPQSTSLPRSVGPIWTACAPLMSAGKYLLLRVGSMLAVFGGSTAIAARIDNVTLAAHQVANSLFIFLALTLDALAVPAQTIVAEELGRDDVPTAGHVARRSVRLSSGPACGSGRSSRCSLRSSPTSSPTTRPWSSRATSALWWLSVAARAGCDRFRLRRRPHRGRRLPLPRPGGVRLPARRVADRRR